MAEHQHKFVVPVEWDERGGYNSSHDGKWVPKIRKVTKLRCSDCPEEIERK